LEDPESYTIFNFCEQTLKMGANDAPGQGPQSATKNTMLSAAPVWYIARCQCASVILDPMRRYKRYASDDLCQRKDAVKLPLPVFLSRTLD
jgi:hypothetical protein